MSLEANLKVVTAPNAIFLGSEVGDFTMNSVNGIHIGTAPKGIAIPAHIRIDEEGITMNEPVTANSVTGTFVTSSITARDTTGIHVSSADGGIRLDGVAVFGSSLIAEDMTSTATMTTEVCRTKTMTLPKATVTCTADRTAVILADSAPLLEIRRGDGSGASIKASTIEVGNLTGLENSAVAMASLACNTVETDSLVVGHSTHSGIDVRGPTLELNKPLRSPGIELADATLAGTAWGALNAVRVVDGNRDGLLETSGVVLVGTDAGATALVNDAGSASVVYVDNGLLSRAAPMTAARLNLQANGNAGSLVVSSEGIIQSDKPINAPAFKVGGTTLSSDSQGIQTDGYIKASAVSINGAGTIAATAAGDLSASATMVLPEVKIRNQVNESTVADLTTDSDGSLRVKATALKVEGQAETLAIVPVPGAIRVQPGALDLGKGDGNWTRIEAAADGVHLGTGALHMAGASIVVDQPHGTLAIQGAHAIDINGVATLNATSSSGKADLSLSANSLSVQSTKFTAETGGVALSVQGSQDFTARSDRKLTLQASDEIGIVLKRKNDTTWSRFSFEAGNKGELRVNGRDIGVTPFDSLAASAYAFDANGWTAFFESNMNPVFRARRYDGLAPALLRNSTEPFVLPGFTDSLFTGTTVTAYINPLGGTTTFKGAWLDIALTSPISLKRLKFELPDPNQADRRPAVWKLFARAGVPGNAEVSDWKEILKGGAVLQTDTTDSELPVYDCYRLAVSAITSGDMVRLSQLQLWGVNPAPTVDPQTSFTGQHLVVPSGEVPFDAFKPGMVVVTGEGHDSIDIGGFKARGGADAITMDAALPMVKLSSVPNDPTVFGVVSGTTINRWATDMVDRRLVVNGLGEGAILVVDTDGPIRNGDLLSTSAVPGYASRQNSEFLANYTVAKATMACDFKPREVPVLSIADEPGPNDLVAWQETGCMQPEYETFELADGTMAALISCTYKCS